MTTIFSMILSTWIIENLRSGLIKEIMEIIIKIIVITTTITTLIKTNNIIITTKINNFKCLNKCRCLTLWFYNRWRKWFLNIIINLWEWIIFTHLIKINMIIRELNKNNIHNSRDFNKNKVLIKINLINSLNSSSNNNKLQNNKKNEYTIFLHKKKL